MTQQYKKKLIEVAIPMEVINAASALEKQPFTRRHPRSMHIWWARRPFVAARAVIFAQLVDDPSAHPDLFPTEKAQDKERKRLFSIIEELVQWENSTNEEVLQKARNEIWQSWRRTCAENADHPHAKELFDRHRLPAFHDPFAGGGALPLEAQRLGLESYASDLNPVAVLINKAMIEIPPKFARREPVNPEWQHKTPQEKALRHWNDIQGLAEDLLHYGGRMRDETEKRIGHLYPKVEVTPEMAKIRPDLRRYVGRKLTVISWIWARTVKSPNPAFADVEVPLASTFMLSTKAGKEAYVEPVIENGGYRFIVKAGKSKEAEVAKEGTKLGRGANFRCLMSGAPITGDYIMAQGQAGAIHRRLMAIVAEGDRERVYVAPTIEHETTAHEATPTWRPDVEFLQQALGFRVGNYGMTTWTDLFVPRQLVALSALTDVLQGIRDVVRREAQAAGMPLEGRGLDAGGLGAEAYADAVAAYLSLAVSRWADLSNSLCSWNNTNQNVRALFSRQAIPMNWDFAELSPFSSVGSWFSTVESSAEAMATLAPQVQGFSVQASAGNQQISKGKVVSTDPPYYDNIGYADLSDFFYVWLRRALKPIFPDLMATVAVPKTEELVATPFRHGGKENAEMFFLRGMRDAMHQLASVAHPALPMTVYYAFKQSETESDGTSSTGWETFLEALINAGFLLTGTWPLRTEREARTRGIGSNALASSIVLVCRPRPAAAPIATRGEFLAVLKVELPVALLHLQRGNIAPVDLAQAAIGPGMGIFTRYDRVIDAEGKALTVRHALTLINEVLDQVLAEQEGDFDADTRWAVAWFEQFGFGEGEYGVAETLSKAKNTSVGGIVDAGICLSKGGKVRLLKPEELPSGWSPESDNRLTVWETVHHLIRTLGQGEAAAATLTAHLGSKAEVARELAYRLYSICERKKRSQEALAYNALVQSWPEIIRLARQTPVASQTGLFEEN